MCGHDPEIGGHDGPKYAVWDAIADTPEQAATLRARAALMRQITAIAKESTWTQTEAAQRCGVIVSNACRDP